MAHSSVTPSNPTRWPTVFIYLVGLLLLVFGLLYIIFPTQMADTSGTMLSSATAVAEYRAYYGGLQLGLGLFLIVMTAKGVETRLMLQLLLYSFACVLITRLASVLLTYPLSANAFDGFHMVAISLELVVVGLTVIALRRMTTR